MQVYAQAQSDQWDSARYLRGLYDHLPLWVMTGLDRFDLADFDTLQRHLMAGVAQGSQFIATHSLAIGQNTFGFVAELFLTVYLAFFLIRDGGMLLDAVRRAVPLAAHHKAELLAKFATVIRATVKGSLLVAAIQGLLGGLAFWALGVRPALLWGVLMAFLSLLPAVGAALVWLPVALFLLATAPLWQGLALLAWGVCVISLADNLLRPLLVGKDTRMPDYVVMLTTLGGMAVFGINGFVIGPTIAALFMAVWHIQAVTQDASIP
jgi:predicted PurR-regulated permease PerM